MTRKISSDEIISEKIVLKIFLLLKLCCSVKILFYFNEMLQRCYMFNNIAFTLAGSTN